MSQNYSTIYKIFLPCLVFLLILTGNLQAGNIYIDPSYTGGNSDGSQSKPFTSWSSISEFESNNSYLQKKGTTCVIYNVIKIYRQSNVTIGTYGEGSDYARIHNQTSDDNSTIEIMASAHCTVEGFHFTGTYDKKCAVRVTDDTQQSDYSGNGNQIKDCFIQKFHWGIRLMKISRSPFDSVLVENVKINNIYDDGIFGQGWGKALHGVDINNCYIDSVNMAYQETSGGGEDIAPGDGIQFSRLVDGWKVRNTTIDRRNSANKFSLVHIDEGATNSCSGLVENCTFFAPNIDNGGNACYFGALDSIIFRYNRVFTNDLSSALVNRSKSTLYCYHNVFTSMGDNVSEKVLNLGGSPNYFYNNTFYKSKKVFTFVSAACTTYVYNNIFEDVGTVNNGSIAIAYSDYNLFHNSTAGEGETNSIYDQDPLFNDVDNNDFSLQAGSPCINKGKDTDCEFDIAGTQLPQGGKYEIGAYELTSTDLEPPGIPTGLTASDISETSFTLTWDASTDNDGLSGYEIYLDGASIKTVYDETALIEGLTQGTTYSVSLTAFDQSGNYSSASSILNVTTLTSSDQEAPEAPTQLTIVTLGQNSATLSWTAATDNVGVTAYDVYLDGVLIKTCTETSSLITGLTADTQYSITIKARDAANNISEASDGLNFTTLEACADEVDWANTSISEQNSSFTVEFDVIPPGDCIDGIVGLSNGEASKYSALACIIQFYTDGLIEARNGDTYMSDAGDIQYHAGITYHIKLDISIETHTYDIYVTPGGENTITLGQNFSFRTDQASVTQLNNYATRAEVCGIEVENFSLNGSSTAISGNLQNEGCTIYPNPTERYLQVHVPGSSNVKVFNLMGQQVLSKKLHSGLNTLDLNIAPGQYVFKIEDYNNSFSKTTMIVVK